MSGGSSPLPSGDPLSSEASKTLASFLALLENNPGLAGSLARAAAMGNTDPLSEISRPDDPPVAAGAHSSIKFKDIQRLLRTDAADDDHVLRGHAARLPKDVANVQRAAKAWHERMPSLIDPEGLPLAADASAVDAPRLKAGAGTYLVHKSASDEVSQVLAPVNSLLMPALSVLDAVEAQLATDGASEDVLRSLAAVRNAVLRSLLVVDLRFDRLQRDKELAGRAPEVVAAYERQLADIVDAPARVSVDRRRALERTRLAAEAAVLSVLTDASGKVAALSAGVATASAAGSAAAARSQHH